MAKVLLIGHCGPDSSYLRMAVSAADRSAQITSADDEQTLQSALKNGIELILLNRRLDGVFPEAEGVELIRRLRRDHPTIKMMLVSEYEDAQRAAVAAGALSGFGKRELGTPRVSQLIRDALKDRAAG